MSVSITFAATTYSATTKHTKYVEKSRLTRKVMQKVTKLNYENEYHALGTTYIRNCSVNTTQYDTFKNS